MNRVRITIWMAVGFMVGSVSLVYGPPPPPRLAAPSGAGGKKEEPSSSSDRARVDTADLDMRAITERAREVLGMPDIKWKHFQTPHFVIHYERSTFAKHVAKMGEFFYDYISKDLGAPKDHIEGRSHLFIFRSAERWLDYQKHSGHPDFAWAVAMVEGAAMYLQDVGDKESSADLLAHETTHVVMNRFFKRRIPTWLNEGLAEWYGELAYDAFKGIHRRRQSQFKDLNGRYPVSKLVTSTTYPEDEAELRVYYDTSKHLVAHFRTTWPKEKFLDLMKDVMAGKEAMEAIGIHYNIHSVEELEKSFEEFLK